MYIAVTMAVKTDGFEKFVCPGHPFACDKNQPRATRVAASFARVVHHFLADAQPTEFLVDGDVFHHTPALLTRAGFAAHYEHKRADDSLFHHCHIEMIVGLLVELLEYLADNFSVERNVAVLIRQVVKRDDIRDIIRRRISDLYLLQRQPSRQSNHIPRLTRYRSSHRLRPRRPACPPQSPF